MPPTLPNPVTLVGSLFSALANYFQQKRIWERMTELADAIMTLADVARQIEVAVAEVFWQVDEAWYNFSGWLSQVGGDIQGMGIDTWAMWHHLRYVLMPGTINWIFNWVLTNWIWPLRKGLHNTIGWSGRWNWYQQGWINDNRAYTRDIQRRGRNWRQAYVYPQLTFLLSPWRVAYWYAQQITVAVSTYLNDSRHSQTRDTVSRVVYSDMSRLWQSFDKHLTEWLQTDVSRNGFGSSVPTFPSDARKSPPPQPPSLWEPWISEPSEPPYPPGAPDIPNVDNTFR